MSDERRLWAAVLSSQIEDAFPIRLNAKRMVCKREAINWIGTFPSSDFKRVCMLAGFEPDKVHSVLCQKLKASDEERKKSGQQIRWMTKSDGQEV